MEYAIIESGGKQYKVEVNDVLDIERISFKKDEKLSFDKVLLHVREQTVKIGKPYIDGFSVEASVIDQIRGEKIRVSRFRAKSRHRRVYGHRQALTKVKITKISDLLGFKEKTEEKVKKAVKKS